MFCWLGRWVRPALILGGGGLAFIIKAPMWIGRRIHKHSRTKRVSVMELNINGFLLSQNPTNEESWCAKKTFLWFTLLVQSCREPGNAAGWFWRRVPATPTPLQTSATAAESVAPQCGEQELPSAESAAPLMRFCIEWLFGAGWWPSSCCKTFYVNSETLVLQHLCKQIKTVAAAPD